jgi:hypothetical protein
MEMDVKALLLTQGALSLAKEARPKFIAKDKHPKQTRETECNFMGQSLS